MTTENTKSTNTEAPNGPAPLLIPPSAFTTLPGPPNAPFRRQQCFDDGHLWMGVVETEPGAASPWHHHGDYDTLVYCLEGEGRIEYGDGSRGVDFGAPGTVVMIPKGLVHREVNTGSRPNKAVVVRVGQGPSIVPVDR